MSFRVGGIHVDVGLKLSNFETGAKSLAKSLKKIEKNFSDVGKSLTTAISVPIAAFGTAAFAAAKSYDDATKTIQKATGATGEALKGLEKSFSNVLVASDRLPSEIAQAMGFVSREFDVAGKSLENITSKMLQLSSVTGEDFNVILDTTETAFQNWSIASDDVTGKLDVLYRLSIATGTAVSAMSQHMVKGGPILRALGFDFDTAAASMAVLADQGIDVERFLSSLEKLPKNIASTGQLKEAFQALVNDIGKGKDAAIALDTAIAAFGARGATGMVEAFKTLKANLGDVLKTAKDTGRGISEAFDESLSFGQRFSILRNVATEALLPIGAAILSGLLPAMQAMKPYLESFSKWMQSLPKETIAWGVGIAAVAAAIGPLASGIGGLIGGIQGVVKAVSMLFGFLAASPMGILLVEITAVVSAVGVLTYAVNKLTPVVVAGFDAAFATASLALKEFDLALEQLTLKIAEWVDAALSSFRTFWHETALGFSLLKEKLGITDEGSSKRYWEENLKSAQISGEFQSRVLQRIIDKKAEVAAADSDLANKNSALMKSLSQVGENFAKDLESVKNFAFGNEELAKTSKEAGAAVVETGKKTKTTGNQANEAADGVGNFNSYLKSAKEKADEAAEALGGLRDKLADAVNSTQLDRLRDGLSKAVENLDQVSFEALKEKYLETTREGTLEGLKEAIEKAGPEGRVEAEKIAAIEVAREKEKLEEQFAEKIKEEHKEAYEESVEFFRKSFENAITGETFNLADTLKQVAVGFGADLAASMSQGATEGSGLMSQLMKGAKSPQDIGANLAKYLFGGGDGKSGLFSNVSFDSLDSFWNGTEVAPGGIWPEDMTVSMGGVSDGLESLATELFAGANSASAYASALMASIKSIPKLGKGTSSTIDGATEIGFSALGAYFGGPVGAQIGSVVGDKVGDWLGGQFEKSDPEYLARHEITGKLEELIAKVGSMQYFDAGGQMHSVSNIVMGESDKFNTPEWSTDVWDTYGEQATQAFVGVGNALTEMLGITEDVGAQVGAMLLEQFNGDSEALKALVQTAGLSYDQFVEFLIARGKEGKETWLGIISQVNEGAEAFQEGLTGSGQYIQAFDNLLATAGRGQISLNQVRNLAVEGVEAGITTLDQLRTMFTESGKYTTEQIDALFAGFQTAGITNLEDIRNATELQLAQVVASMDAYFQDHGIQWSKATEDVRKYEDQLNKLSGKQVDIEFNLKSNIDPELQSLIDQGLVDMSGIKFDGNANPGGGDFTVNQNALGGVLHAPAFVAPGELAGEAGPEGIFPLKRMGNGELGVRADVGKGGAIGGVSIYVDARGADAGVEQRLNSMFSDLEQRVVERSVSVIIDSAQRGGLRGFF